MHALQLRRRHLKIVSARVERQITTALEHGALAAARAAHAELDLEKARAEAHSSGPGLACSAGCSACCHVHVEVTRPELVSIAELLAARPLAERDAIRARLALRTGAAQLSDDARWAARLPCALLDAHGRCSIYDRRPLRCRSFHSTARAACEAAFAGSHDADPPLDAGVARATSAVEVGYERALTRAGVGEPGLLLEKGLADLLAGEAQPSC